MLASCFPTCMEADISLSLPSSQSIGRPDQRRGPITTLAVNSLIRPRLSMNIFPGVTMNRNCSGRTGEIFTSVKEVIVNHPVRPPLYRQPSARMAHGITNRDLTRSQRFHCRVSAQGLTRTNTSGTDSGSGVFGSCTNLIHDIVEPIWLLTHIRKLRQKHQCLQNLRRVSSA